MLGMDEVELRTPRSDLDYTTRDYDGFRNMMLQKLKDKIPEYSDFSENDLGVVLIELLALGQDIQSYYIDKVANESRLNTAMERQNIIELCATLDYTLKYATPSHFKQVFKIEPNEELDTVIPQGFALNTFDNGFDEILTFETTEELVIPKGATGEEVTRDTGEYLYAVEVVQGRTIPEELLGTSTGLPNQEFKLWESPVISSSIEILVNEGNGFEPWTRVNSFIRSKNTDKHYMVRMDGSSSATIIFGNGILGAIPQPYDGGILARYRVGGGTVGNVAPNTITEMVQPLANIQETYNPKVAFIEGTDIESSNDAKCNAIRGLRTLERAVTLQDFKDLAFKLPFTKLSDALDLDDGKTVDIYILPNTGKTLTPEQKAEALSFYDSKKMACTKPVIKDPVFVSLNLKVVVDKLKRDTTDYNTLVKSIVEDYFKLGNFNFQQRFSQSQLLRELMLLLPDVDDITVTLTSPHPELTVGQIVTLGDLTVEVI